MESVCGLIPRMSVRITLREDVRMDIVKDLRLWMLRKDTMMIAVLEQSREKGPLSGTNVDHCGWTNN